MPWVRIDTEMPHHPKFMAIPRARRCAAIGLHTMALCYCNAHLTDGFFPRSFIGEVPGGRALADELLNAGIWLVVDDRYVIHDYLDFQPSRQDVEAKRLELAEARSRGGRARAGTADRSGKGQFVKRGAGEDAQE